ncbi:AI-2E family transporter [Candidatus Microgenomates bacterium]|nr:AI-2E family transporter [Candidatus Microgenomates bacterium]
MYTVLRQLEDLFIIPQIMGRLTKLHPLVVLFSVLVGGHVFGVIGYVIAVPVVASVKVVLEHIIESQQKAL